MAFETMTRRGPRLLSAARTLLLAALLLACVHGGASAAPAAAAVAAPDPADGAGDTASRDPVVETSYGPVKGIRGDKGKFYLGIPFAAPPVGALRWRPPQPPKTWVLPRAAKHFPVACAQPLQAKMANSSFSEDCLYLNVFTPLDDHPEKLPVQVWFHGGAFIYGSSNKNEYDAERIIDLQRQPMVVVTINYRLGLFGFLGSDTLRARCGALNCTGVYGLQDQTFALQWVQANIARFGGDVHNVLVYGQSAGAASAALHLFMQPPETGLFTRVALESGSVAVWTTVAMARAEEKFVGVLKATNCSDAACLEALPTDVLVAAENTSIPLGALAAAAVDGNLAEGLLPWAPVLDGVVLPVSPMERAPAGAFSVRAPMILGATTMEMTSLLPLSVRDLTPLQYLAVCGWAFGNDAAAVMLRYPSDQYASTFLALVDLLGDFAFICPARQTARWATAAGLPAYLYSFAHAPADPAAPGWPENCEGPCHGAEIPFLFHDAKALDAAEDALALTMVDYWRNFAGTGDPNAGAPVPEWPLYVEAKDENLRLGLEIEREKAFKRAKCDFWAAHPPDALAAAWARLALLQTAGMPLVELITLAANGTAAPA